MLLGYVFAALRDHHPERLHHPFFAIGICGALTTFATLQLELYQLVDAGDLGLAAGYCLATVALGYGAVQLGIGIERRRPRPRRAAA